MVGIYRENSYYRKYENTHIKIYLSLFLCFKFTKWTIYLLYSEYPKWIGFSFICIIEYKNKLHHWDMFKDKHVSVWVELGNKSSLFLKWVKNDVNNI